MTSLLLSLLRRGTIRTSLRWLSPLAPTPSTLAATPAESISSLYVCTDHMVCVCVCERVSALTGPPSWVMEGDDQDLVAGKQHTNEIRTIQPVGDQVYTLGYDKTLRSFPQASNEFR